MLKVKIQILEGCSTGTVDEPTYATPGSSGFDIICQKFLKHYRGEVIVEDLELNNEEGSFMLFPGNRVLIGTGYRMDIPEGYELQIRSRSSSFKHGIIVLNQPGTIDSDYRGEIGVILYNSGTMPQELKLGNAYAQGVFCPVVQAQFIPVKELNTTARGEGGFGSTGKLD